MRLAVVSLRAPLRFASCLEKADVAPGGEIKGMLDNAGCRPSLSTGGATMRVRGYALLLHRYMSGLATKIDE